MTNRQTDRQTDRYERNYIQRRSAGGQILLLAMQRTICAERPILSHVQIRRAYQNVCLFAQNLRRNSSGDEIANVNFLYDIVHTLQNTIDSCINSATDRRSYVLERRFTKFSKITQCNGHYAVRGHSRSPFWYQSKTDMRLPISD